MSFYLLTIQDLSNFFVAVVFLSFLITTIYVIIKFLLSQKRMLLDKRLSGLFLFFSLSCGMYYVHMFLPDQPILSLLFDVNFIISENVFLCFYFYLIYPKRWPRIWLITSLGISCIAFLLLKFMIVEDLHSSLIRHLYYTFMSLLIPISIFIFLIKAKDDISKKRVFKSPIILVSLGILTCYILRVNVNASLAIIQLYDSSFLIKPLSFYSHSISLITIIELLSFVVLNIFMLRAIAHSHTNNEKIRMAS